MLQVNFGWEKPWPNTAFPLHPRKASDHTEQLTPQTIPLAELPPTQQPKAKQTPLGAYGGREFRQGFYGPLSRPAPAFWESDYVAYVTIPVALGPWLGTTDLCTQMGAVRVGGGGCFHESAHPEVSTQGPWGWPPRRTLTTSTEEHIHKEKLPPAVPEPDTLFTFSLDWETSWVLGQKLKFIKNLNVP